VLEQAGRIGSALVWGSGGSTLGEAGLGEAWSSGSETPACRLTLNEWRAYFQSYPRLRETPLRKDKLKSMLRRDRSSGFIPDMNASKLNVNPDKLNAFLGRALNDMGAAFQTALIITGERLGLYKAMAGAGALTPGELASRTETDERYVREWLCAQAASGYVEYDAASEKFTLPDEQALLLAVDTGPAYLPAAYQIIASTVVDEPQLRETFKTGFGFGWHQHSSGLFDGTERFFRPSYLANLITSWIPALEGAERKLQSGARVADVGCGHGASTILMAQAYPKSEFVGYDYHEASIQRARERAKAAGVSERLKFEVSQSKNFPGKDFDLVAFFDCLHDMGDPVGAAKHVRAALKPDGTWLIVEPAAGDRIEQNLNPVGRVYYAASTMICTPASKSQDVGLALGAQAGEARLRDVATKGGFTRFRRATETPFNMVLEARP
jgi:SAM-dependent methyltransferase